MKKEKEGYDYLSKLVIIGDSGVGKTNILIRFCEKDFKDNYVATIGVDFKMKTINVEGVKYKLQLWDTAGQQRFKNITQTYYRGAVGIILVYSITDENSFQSVERWITQIQQNTSKGTKIILVGNKTDMQSDRQVSFEEGRKFAQKNQIPFIECSAKSGNNVNQMFDKIGLELKDYYSKQGKPRLSDRSVISLNKSQCGKQKQSDCKC